MGGAVRCGLRGDRCGDVLEKAPAVVRRDVHELHGHSFLQEQSLDEPDALYRLHAETEGETDATSYRQRVWILEHRAPEREIPQARHSPWKRCIESSRSRYARRRSPTGVLHKTSRVGLTFRTCRGSKVERKDTFP